MALEKGQIEIYINDKKKGKIRFIANTQVINESKGAFFILWAIINVTKYHQSIQEQQRTLKELDALNAKLLLERDYLRDEYHLTLEFGKQVGSLSAEQLIMLQEYHWPGNIRELKNIIERAVILSKEHIRIDLAFPEQAVREIGSKEKERPSLNSLNVISDKLLKEIEKNNIVNALEATNWRISGKKGAANLLEVNPSTLSSKVRALKIKKPEKNSLYNRLGGVKNITPLVDELLAKLRSDEQLGRHWKDRGIDNIRMEKKYVVDYFCDLTGGPFTYTGRNMIEVHKGMGITEADWEILTKHIIAILSKYNLSENDSEELFEIINNVKNKLITY